MNEAPDRPLARVGCVATAYSRPSTFTPDTSRPMRVRVAGDMRLTNQGNRRPPRREAPPVGVRVDRVVRRDDANAALACDVPKRA